MMLFCGHDPFCAEFNSKRALLRAKENVERHYAVVGVIEEVNKTLAVLEDVLPDVFKGDSRRLFRC
jgi:dermatan/chondrotin sulfate uronyl 2-O-sulfotransferase UST